MDLHLQPELTQTEEEEGLIPISSAPDPSGRWRWKTIKGFAESLFRRNPQVVVWEKTTLFDGDAQGNQGIENNTIYNLDFESGNSGPRHDFTDAYTHFLIKIGWNTLFFSPFLPAPALLESSTSDPLWLSVISAGGVSGIPAGIAKVSDTSFRVGLNTPVNTGTNTIVSKIIGYKMVIKPKSLV